MSSAVLCAASVIVAASLCRALARPPLRPAPAASARDDPASRWRWLRESPGARRWTARRRVRQRRAAWAAVADEVSATLRSGATLHQAMASVAAQAGDAADVVQAALGPVERGRPMAVVALEWTERAADPDELLLAEAFHLAASAGRAEPLLFDEVADVIRERRALAGELRAQTAQARASAVVLGLLPIAFTGLVALSDPDVTRFLFAQPAGRACIVLGLTFEAGGAWWMRHIIGSVLP